MTVKAAIVWVSIVSSSTAAAADWTRFRGPGGSGVASEAKLPEKLDPEDNLVWRVKTPRGSSSPVVYDDKVFLAAEENDQRIAICLDAKTGKILWRRAFASARAQPTHERSGQSAPTPVVDATGAYLFFTDIGLIALDADGGVRWQVPLGPFRSIFGMSSSPLLTQDAVVLVLDQTAGSHIAAFSKENGELLWRRDRPNGSGAYATPVLIEGDLNRILVSGAGEVALYDASTGKLDWRLDGLPTSSFSSPVAGKGMAYVPMAGSPAQSNFSNHDRDGDGRMTDEELDSGLPGVFRAWARSVGDGDGQLTAAEFEQATSHLSGGRSALFAIQLPALTEDQNEESIRWTRYKGSPFIPSPLLYRGILYVVINGGILTALEAGTGAVLKEGRLREAVDTYTASPAAADGRVLFAGESGKLTVIRAGADWEILNTHDLGETVYASPAVVGNYVYVRTTEAVWRFGPTASRPLR